MARLQGLFNRDGLGSKGVGLARKSPDPVDWVGARTERIKYKPGTRIFARGDPAPSVMYVEQGTVRLSVLSHAGQEAVVAVLDVAHFFGEAKFRRLGDLKINNSLLSVVLRD